jgi:hypothetical protein
MGQIGRPIEPANCDSFLGGRRNELGGRLIFYHP